MLHDNYYAMRHFKSSLNQMRIFDVNTILFKTLNLVMSAVSVLNVFTVLKIYIYNI